MIRYHNIAIFFVCLSLLNCQPKEQKSTSDEAQKITNSVTFDSLNYCVLKYDSTFYWIFPENFVNAQLTDEDLNISEPLLHAEIRKFNEDGQIRKDSLNRQFPNYQFYEEQFSINLQDYRRQYVIGTTPTGDKLLHINFFCGTEGFEYWKDEYVIVDDGGNCFFQVLINISKNELLEFSVNGVA